MATDIELLRAWHDSRDAEAFKELTRRYAGLVHAAAKRILGNAATAEDVTQESFERLAMTTHPPQGPMAPWLHRVATNRALDRVRAQQSRRQREQQYADGQADEASAVVWNDVYAHVDAAINALPENLRMPMVEHFYRDRSAADIAEELGLTRQAVSYRIRKGVEGVRRTLRKRGISMALGSLTALLSANLAEAAPLPASLSTSLGKLAVAGVVGSNLNTAATAATIMGGVLVMKKAVAIGAIVIAALVGIWTVPKLYAPKAEPSPPSYVPRTDTPQPVPAVAEEPEESAVEPATPTGDITGRFYNVITGEGIQGMRPHVSLAENGLALGQALNVEGSDSDASGTYKLTGLKPGQYAVRAPRTDAYPGMMWGVRGMDSLFITVAANSVVRNIDFGLEPGASVTGVVVSSGGEPVEGAKVIGRPMETSLKGTTTSGPDGTFELFVPVYDGALELQASKDGLYSPIVDSLSFSYEGLKDIVLELTEERTASISGSVVDPIGLPVEGVIVTLYGGAFPLDTMSSHHSVETAPGGAFRVDQLLADDFSVYISPAGRRFHPFMDQEVAVLSLRPGESIDGLRFTFGRNLSISGHVVDPSGQPIKNAYIFAKPASSVFVRSESYAVSDADGRFVLAGLESGEYVVSVRVGGERTATEAGTFPTGTEDLEIVSGGLGSVGGRVVRADTGKALTQFRIYVLEGKLQRLQPHLFYAAFGGALTYDPEGRFVRECSRALAHNGFVTVIAASPGFAPNLQSVQIPENGIATGVEVRLEPSRLIEGRVIDTLGQPVAGARISWGPGSSGRDTSRVVARSDPSGFFSVESIPADEHVLSASHPSYAPSALPVASEMTFVLQAGGMLEGRVWAKEGGPHNVRCVTVICPWLPSGAPFTSFPGPDGTYRIAGIPAGTVDVAVYLNKTQATIDRRTNIASGRTTTEDFEVEGGGAIVHGQIQGNGVNPERVFLELTVSAPEGAQTYRAKGAADGTYRIPGVVPGQARL